MSEITYYDQPKPEKSKKTILIVLLAVALLASSAYYYFFIFSSRQKAPSQTGAVIIQGDDTIFEPLDQFYALMEATPVEQQLFTIQANYKDNVLDVTLKEPIDQADLELTKWLQIEGYSKIPEDKIQLILE